MKTRKQYLEIFREIASNQGVSGQMSEILSQMLAEAMYINEVEQITTVREASIESAVLVNSKIQHCMDQMYSVYRGTCPRILMKFQCRKSLTLNPYDIIYSSNKFNIYYLGYCTENSSNNNLDKTGEKVLNYSSITESEDLFSYSGVTIPPTGEDNTYVIIGLISPGIETITRTTDCYNTYYVDLNRSDLSNDIYVKIAENENNSYIRVSREFSDHVEDSSCAFDLTTTSYGTRIYIPEDYRDSNITITIGAFKYCELSSFNTSELKQIKISGTKLIDFDDTVDSWASSYIEDLTGIIFIDEITKDLSNTIHYRANKNRYINNLIRSNSDIGTKLEEEYPEKVVSSGTTWKYTPDSYLEAKDIEGNSITDGSGNPMYYKNSEASLIIYYIPKDTFLNTSEIDAYINKYSPYFVCENINITNGLKYIAEFHIEVEVYSSDTDITEDINNILEEYEYKFGIDLGPEKSFEDSMSENSESYKTYNSNSLRNEIIPLINKISNVRRITNFEIVYKDGTNNTVSYEDIREIETPLYFETSLYLNENLYIL